MARYRLIAKHYLNVPGTEWEQVETDQHTGRQVRKRYTVPRHLDPDMPSDWNYPNDGIIIVSDREDPSHPNDIVFIGEPTLDMVPLDDEARAKVEAVAKRGQHPIESLPGQGEIFSDRLLATFETALNQALAKQGGIPKATVGEDRIAMLEAQVAELTRMLAAGAPPGDPASSADDKADSSVVVEEPLPVEAPPPPPRGSTLPGLRGLTVGVRP